MNNIDLTSAINIIRDALFTEEEQQEFQRIIDRLEGYELAYSVIVNENERLEKKVIKLNEDIQILTKQRDELGKSNSDYQKDWHRRGEKIINLQNELTKQSQFYEERLQQKNDEIKQ